MIALKNVQAVEFEPASIRNSIDVLIENGMILKAGKDAAAGCSCDEEIDLNGKILMPGLVCGHNHFYSGLARGILAPLPPSPDFVSRLQNLWWRLDRALDEDSLYAAALICCFDAIQAGTTAVADHHSSQSFIKGSLDIMKRAFLRTGLRGTVCFETTDRNGREQMLAGVEENLRFARECREAEVSGAGTIPLVAGMIGGHAPFTLSDEALKLLGDAAENSGLGFHVHCAEDRFDASYSHAVYGKDLIQRLDNYGLISERTLIAHGLYLRNDEIDFINEKGSFLAHNPRSNMNNAVGYNSRLPRYFNVTIGTDGIGSDMFEELKFAYFKHQETSGELGPADFLKLLYNGNSLLKRSFGARFGRIQPGYAADLVVSSYRSPTPLAAENLGGHMIYGMKSADIETVIINGSIVYRDRRFPKETGEIYEQARAEAEKLWRRMEGREYI